jgi:hypothetical protein
MKMKATNVLSIMKSLETERKPSVRWQRLKIEMEHQETIEKIANSMHVNSDDEGHPYVYGVTDDEQIEVLYSGRNEMDCRLWINKRARAIAEELCSA